MGVNRELHGVDVVILDGRSGSGKTSLAARIAERFRADGRPAAVLHVEDLYPGWDGLAAGSRAVPEALAMGVYRRYDWEARAFAERVPVPAGVPLIIEGCGALTAANLAAAVARVRAGSSERVGADAAERVGAGAAEQVRADAAERARAGAAARRSADGAAPGRSAAGTGERVAAMRAAGEIAGGSGAARQRVRAVWLDCPEALRRERALARDGDVFAPHWERWAAQEAAFFAAHEPWALADEVIACDV
ncbi:hypothetical protein MUN77_04915 [Leucobacter allii]|uniref:hypothetical protein n=1 Tax=Leucobacter allii TaxID=2932247 RepID=UPI001FD116B9|nr:hypothetical protein [Leucobacter allii]UOR02654.1 hypothetical protein MUN77_04915 [Leucobacter allii]